MKSEISTSPILRNIITRNITNYLNGRRLILFGAGEFADHVLRALVHPGMVDYICDNDWRKWETLFAGLPVVSPEKLLSEKKEDIYILIAVKSQDTCTKIEAQLDSMGLSDVYGQYTILKDMTEDTMQYLPLTNDKLKSDMKDGFFRIRLTNRCNAKCKFCYRPNTNYEMPKELLFKQLKPLYEKISLLMCTGGEATCAEYSLEFFRYMHRNFPGVTLVLESNGIAFDETWQQELAGGLASTHFSINAGSEEAYLKGCWDGDAGRRAFHRVWGNVREYIKLLHSKGLAAFAPTVSMVVSSENAYDVREFVRKSLETGVNKCSFLFETSEADISMLAFRNPEYLRPALLEIAKMERVLENKFLISYKLFLPPSELYAAENIAKAIPLAELQREYVDIINLADSRSIQGEYEERSRIRAACGKKHLSKDGDLSPWRYSMMVDDARVCNAPFNTLTLDGDGTLWFCCLATWHTNISEYTENGVLNIDRMLNSDELKRIRAKMLCGNYDYCGTFCPLNPTFRQPAEGGKR